MGLTRTTRWLATALALLAVGCAHAADDDLTSSTTSLVGNGTISLTPEVLGPLLVQTIQTNLAVGQRRLIVMRGMPPAIQNNCPLICNGAAAIVTHTPTLKSNGECFKDSSMPSLASDLSCTCLNYLPANEWTFKISKSTFSNETYPPLISSIDEIIALDSMMIYGVGPSVETLNLIGVGDSPIKIQFMPSPIQGASTTEPAIVISALASNLTALRVENLAIDGEIGKGFVPSALTNLTMKNCMIRTFKSELFASLLGKLKSLDLSGNLLSGVYQDITDKTCVAQICNITSMNLSSNDITTMPSYLLNLNKLTTLSLRNNPINYTVDTTTFASLERLSVLDIDEVENCSSGQLEVLGSTKLCVYNATTAATPTPASSTSDGGGSTSYLIYVVIGGCLVIVVLAFLLVKRNSWRSRSDDGDFTKEPLDAYFDNTLAYDDTHPTISASLLNDPIIITHRLPYKDLRVANCISKGGFGLVYSGVYNRRRVAIKKIRPDRAGDIKQIESFLKEICLMATLNHPRIVEFVGVSWDSLRNLCAVTEFMERGDLREVLHGFKLRNTPLTWESNKTAIALHIAEGLTYLHSLSPKVIHRDLKSKNVLLNGEMTAKLSDFGISRERNIEETHMTAGIGTSFWIAPEVLLGKDYDEHADIFSFGVVLSEIDTDDYPYWNASNPNVGNKAQENMILQMVASGAMRPSFSDTCPKAILELADLCLQVEPDNRPTAAEVAYKLQQIVAFMNPPSTGGRVAQRER